MGYHRFNSLCVIRVGGFKMLWIITGYGLSQYRYGLSQVWLYLPFTLSFPLILTRKKNNRPLFLITVMRLLFKECLARVICYIWCITHVACSMLQLHSAYHILCIPILLCSVLHVREVTKINSTASETKMNSQNE